MPELASDLLEEPVMATTPTLKEHVKNNKTGEHSPTMLEALQFYNVIHQEERRKYKTQEAKQTAIYKWIADSVNPSLHQSTLAKIRKDTGKREVSLRKITKTLKESFSPGLMVITGEILYVKYLAEAKLANTHPDRWIEKWYAIYQKAVTYDVNEIQGPNAIRDFVQAVGAQFEPIWARGKLGKMVEYNDKLPADFTLKATADEFIRYYKATKMLEPSVGIAVKGVHATLGTRSDTEKGQKTSNKSKNNNCPCGFSHDWKPEECRTLIYAITNKLIKKKKIPTKEICDKIKLRYESQKWEHLRSQIAKDGWKDSDAKKENIPGHISAAIIDPKDIPHRNSVYATTGPCPHMFAESTLLDNCGAMHVVNDRNKLEKGTFRETTDDYLEAGTTSFPISERGTRIIRNVINGNDGHNTKDLILHDVAVVEGFHVNIVS
ncbi:hypothetical protein E4U15_004141 [Claviceps sp. LM218 group G6]|nr:hypothetical protein E4U15_004141 [Claviceps sp. LM218 group G6]